MTLLYASGMHVITKRCIDHVLVPKGSLSTRDCKRSGACLRRTRDRCTRCIVYTRLSIIVSIFRVAWSRLIRACHPKLHFSVSAVTASDAHRWLRFNLYRD